MGPAGERPPASRTIAPACSRLESLNAGIAWVPGIPDMHNDFCLLPPGSAQTRKPFTL